MFIIERKKKEMISYYFAIIYKIFYKDKFKHEDEITIDMNNDPYFVRIAFNFDEDRNKVNDLKVNDDHRIMFLPQMNRKGEEERDVLYISASSGSGKSYLVNQFAEVYNIEKENKNKIFFLTSNNHEKDKSLSQDIYNFINVDEFLDYYSDDENMKTFIKDGSEFDNSLIIFDDIGAINDKDKVKTLWHFINIILENKRKNCISICVISHVPTDYKKTSILIRETKKYIVFPKNLQVNSDRFLKTYLGLSKSQITFITDLQNTKWCAVDVGRKLLITQRQIKSLS